MKHPIVQAIAIAVVCSGCGRLRYEPSSTEDAFGLDAWSVPDGGPPSIDGALPDAGLDAASNDASAEDAATDAWSSDAWSPDARAPDAPPLVDAAPDAGMPGIRMVAPLATETVARSSPTFRFTLVGGADGGLVEVCRDAACTMPISSFSGAGTAIMPVPLPLGAPRVFHWRVTPTVGGVVAGSPTAAWPFVARAAPSPGAPDTSWGAYLDVDSDDRADHAVSVPDAGEVLVYRGAAGGPLTTPVDSFVAGLAPKRLVLLGDVDGDGRADLGISEPGMAIVRVIANLAPGAWRPYDVRGPADSEFGDALVGLGDLDRDGYADFAVGAPVTREVHVFRGGASGPEPVARQILTDLGGRFGAGLAAGDFDGDGTGDLAVGASGADRVHLYRGRADGTFEPAAVPVLVGVVGSGFGTSIDGGADVSCDGYPDLTIGAPLSMRVVVHFGSPAGLGALPDRTIDGMVPRIGAIVAHAGDTDGNGCDDVLMADGISSWFLYPATPGGWSTTLSQTMPALTRFTESVGLPGDLDGDGLADFAIGDPESAHVIVFGGASRYRVDLRGPMGTSFGATQLAP